MTNPTSKKPKITSLRNLDQLKQSMIDEALLTKEDIHSAEAVAEAENKPFQDILIQLKFITENKLNKFIASKINIPYVDLKNYVIDNSMTDIVPEKIARRYQILPIFFLEGVLTIAITNPMDIISIDEISAVVGHKVEPVLASAKSINNAIELWYCKGGESNALFDSLVEELQEIHLPSKIQVEIEKNEQLLVKEASEPPIVRLVNGYIVQAMLENASDIHLEPKKDIMQVRFRIDGFLYDRHKLPAKLAAPAISRIKIMSELDISKKNIPQDGRMGIVIRNMDLDLRISTYPTMYGEKVVLRLLNKTKGVPTLQDLGFNEKDLKTFQDIIKIPKGVILATGPTGSGKTTTIYSAISAMNTGEKNITTIEDPIEYEIHGIVQSQINETTGLTFATALKSILRQDPDIIYLGEIRDRDTADIAVRSALTGHLVLSTLHTNDAVGAVTRLRDIGIDTGIVESVLVCSFAQRLVRKVCQKCRQEYKPDKEFLENMNLPLNTTLYKAKGCEFCFDIGYIGRIGIYEILIVNNDIRKLIANQVSESKILEAAKANGMNTLFEDGMKKVLKGLTTYEEIIRVTEK